MDSISPPLDRLALLPSYWQPVLNRLSLECRENGSFLTLPKLLLTIRDMPYRRPMGKAPGAKECVTQWRGTCSTKHLAVYELLDTLSLDPRMWLACYRLDFMRPYYSEQLRGQAGETPVYDVHNYLTCALSGKSLIIDVTFPEVLGCYGLPVTHSWTGNDDFVLCCAPEAEREVNVADADRAKREWLATLNSDEALRLRELAIQELMKVAARNSLG